MPGSHTPVPHQFGAMIADFEQRLQALERSQQFVFTDPTGATGDPANGHAVAVAGSLKQIAGINAFGIAAWSGSAWAQLPETLGGLLGATHARVGTGTLTWAATGQFSAVLNLPLTGASGTVQLIGTAENQLGVGITVHAAPDGAGGSNVQGFASAAPGVHTNVFAFLQWGS